MRAAVTTLALVISMFAGDAAAQGPPSTPVEWPNLLRCTSWIGVFGVLAGRWQSADGGSSAAFVCGERDGRQIWLGVVPHGKHEGVIGNLESETVSGITSSFEGQWRSVAAPLTPQLVKIKRSSENQLEVCWRADECVRLQRIGPVNTELLGRMAIVGHRAASLGHSELANTAAGVRTAAEFGCTGVEIDIVIPYIQEGGRKVSRPQEMRVTHPPEIRSELTGFDSIRLDKAAGHPRLSEVLSEIKETPIALVYLDLKLRWLNTDRAAISEVIAELERQIAASRLPSSLVVLAGAEVSKPGSVADVLGDQTTRPWILEFTRGTNAERFHALATKMSGAPAALSFSLLRVRDGGGGLLGWTLRDLPDAWENRYRELPQLKIFWTANSDEQMKGAIKAVQRFAPGPTAVLTAYPHRLAWLAAQPMRESLADGTN